MLGDGVTANLPGLFARLYDGDPGPLRNLIEAEHADQFARDAAIETLAWLTIIGRIDRDDTARYLGDLFTTLKPRDECYVGVGWQQAIAALGLADLAPLVETAFERGWIDTSVLLPRHFHKDLKASQSAGAAAEALLSRMTDIALYDDAVALLSTWHSFQPKEKPKTRSHALSWTPQSVVASTQNSFRKVGRNDPCPCGSGKKFKKCCFNTAA